MPISTSGYDEAVVMQATAKALDDFYTSLIANLGNLSIRKVMRRKNPYLFRAKAMNGAAQIVDALLSAFVSSSEETIFGNVFFEPIALAASGGIKAPAEGVDIMVDHNNTLFAIAVKSGTSVFNGDSRKKQEQNFAAVAKRAQQAHRAFMPIVGYSYGRKSQTSRGTPKLYVELAGQAFWRELTGDEDFYLKLIRFMDALPERYIEEFNAEYQRTTNRLLRDFTADFCRDDGSIDWERLVEFNSGEKYNLKPKRQRKE